MGKKTELVDRIQATGDKERSVTILVFQEFILDASSGGTQWVEWLKSGKTEDGRHVNRISDTEYKIVITGEVLTVKGDHRAG